MNSTQRLNQPDLRVAFDPTHLMRQIMKSRFLEYSADIEEPVFEFQEREYPNRAADEIPSRWRWLFVTSANRLGIAPLVWLYERAGRIVAHQGAIPVRLKAGDEEISTGWFVETMAASEIRGSAIGPMLIRKALEDLPTNLSLGQTEQMRQIQLRLGWQPVLSLPKYVFICGYRMDLHNKLPFPLAGTASAALGTLFAYRHWRNCRAPEASLSFEQIDRFTSEHDELWTSVAPTCKCAVVRDASYLNWKYVERTFRDFTRIEMRKLGVLVGVVIVFWAAPNEVYRYTRGYIVDVVVRLDRPGWFKALICEGIRVLKKKSAQTVVCHIHGPSIDRQLRQMGFMRRPPRLHFLVAADPSVPAAADTLVEPNAWYLTLGDSDADSYPD